MLYYPRQRRITSALRAFVDAIREGERGMARERADGVS
jgi:hypothetical protein